MSHDPQHDPDSRDRVISRMAAEELRNPGAASDAAAGAAPADCPDPETLAAYADGSLDPNETARWENHFADCGRCPKILAALVLSADEPMLQQEVQKIGQPVGPLAVPVGVATRSKEPTVMPLRRTLRWLVPATGVAAALLLWFMLRPANPTQDLVSQNVAPGNSVLPNLPVPPDLSAPSEIPPNAPFSSSEAAQGEVPPPPTSPFTPQTAEQGAPGFGQYSPGQNPLPQNPAADSFSAANAARQEATLPPSVAPSAPGALDSTRAQAVAPPVPREKLLVAPSDETLSAANQKSAPPAAAVSSNAARSPASSVTGGVSGSLSGLARSQTLATSIPLVAAPEKKVTPTFNFSSPGGVQWRGGTSGLIERSTDQGRTWQAQPSGVTVDLASGAATSNQVAWVVGHAGVILRTTDGVSWQRVVSPNATITDWIGVTASDAQHATITSKDQRRFTTSDGGQNWTPQP